MDSTYRRFGGAERDREIEAVAATILSRLEQGGSFGLDDLRASLARFEGVWPEEEGSLVLELCGLGYSRIHTAARAVLETGGSAPRLRELRNAFALHDAASALDSALFSEGFDGNP